MKTKKNRNREENPKYILVAFDKEDQMIIHDYSIDEENPYIQRMELDDQIDDILYIKPVAFVKKLKRHIDGRYK